MSIRSQVETYRALRQSPIWKLLAADTGPVTIAILQDLLFDNERELPASVFLERLIHAYREGAQETISREEARALAGRWVKEGYLVCRLTQGQNEESYELTSAGQEAIRTLSRFQVRRTGPTESRLEMVTHAISRLAADSDRSKEGRIRQLEAEKARLDDEIRAIRAGKSPSIGKETALGRVYEIFELVGELEADFRRVREEFERLNRELREKILKSASSRGVILDKFFAGVDGISESEAGRAFSAFYRLLTNDAASEELESALMRISRREFFSALSKPERERLLRLNRMLRDRASGTHTVMTQLARSLRDFVRSRDYMEERRLGALIREARKAALDLSKDIGLKETFLDFNSTSASISSVSRYELDDPDESKMDALILDAPPPTVNSLEIFERVLAAEIDFPALMRTIDAALSDFAVERVSIAEIYRVLPRQQGLGSIVGLLSLAAKYAQPAKDEMPSQLHTQVLPQADMEDSDYFVPLPLTQAEESLTWKDKTDRTRTAQIPLYYFTRESVEKMRQSHRWRKA